MVKGLSFKKEINFGEWYSEVTSKAGFMDYSKVKGCIIFKPPAMFVWKKVQKFFDERIQTLGVSEVYFPLFIPESLLVKEAEHVEGFAPEVAWVDYGGDTKLGERLALRPTSETLMYDSFKNWVRSHRDLPIKVNQWCNIIRWEFKHPTPFIRTREFLWQEGHTLHSSKKEADFEVFQILEFYRQVHEDLLAVPVLVGVKSDKEKFAGADFTTSLEAFSINGKGIQTATSHGLGQNFSKAFSVKYTNKKEEEVFPFTNSWGLSTRVIGSLIMTHADNKGMVFPPLVAPIQLVIVPIFKDETKTKIFAFCKNIETKLKKFGVRVFFDSNESVSPGFKFNQYELEGVPLRVEIGLKEFKDKNISFVKRFDGGRFSFKLSELKQVEDVLKMVQKKMFSNAKKSLNKLVVNVSSMKELINVIENKKVGVLNWCGNVKCEEDVRKRTGAKSGNISLKKNLKECVLCLKKAIGVVRFAKYY